MLAADIERKLALEHETSARALEAVLKGGEFLSMDELVRRKIRKPEDKLRATRPDVDGEVGEQDVVFVAIREKLTSEWAFSFGDLTVTFDKDRLLEEGYFSLFPFGAAGIAVGEATGGWSPGCGVPRYQRALFKGKAAYLRLLEFSIAQILWERDRALPRSRPKETLKLLRLLGQEPIKNPKLIQRDRVPAVDSWVDPRAESSEDGTVKKKDGVRDPGDVLQLLAAYRGFPEDRSDFPPLYAYGSGFWELKAPRKISVDLIESIAIPVECDAEGATEQWCGNSKKAILDYAEHSGRRYRISRAPHPMHKEVVIYTFESGSAGTPSQSR
ncbi:MAG: hypothetical protein NDJ90_08760 [Oligoflexia bacterium]|nr:hypothetical protein [Oligoflexia bacterium]